jgi:hypothetical protein
MIPTRIMIQRKIDRIKSDPQFSTLRSEVIEKITIWLESLKMPQTITQFGEEVNPKEKILQDLDTYDF